MEEDILTLKNKRRDRSKSRVERSRLSLITFLNNITVPSPGSSSHGNSKNLRSQSITSPFHGRLVRQPMINQTSQKYNKDVDLKVIEQGQPHIIGTLSIGDMSGIEATISLEKNCDYDISQCPVLTDKQSIKSGASTATSSNISGPIESFTSTIPAQSCSYVSKSQKLRECSICCIRQLMTSFYKLNCCSHLICRICLIKYLNLEIMESRTNITCPECPAHLFASDIYAILEHHKELLNRFELFSLRKALSADPDTRWCPAPDCSYAVIAHSCAACPQLRCERCATMFCYHCKNYWHPNQTCDQARARNFLSGHNEFDQSVRSPLIASFDIGGDVMKACPRCGALIMKMNDGSCNHMQCALCNSEFCWLCLKQINELHYLSPTGCTFWGKKPWTRKKKLLWQIGTLIGAPLGIVLIAGLAIPGIICGVPIFVGRKTYQRFSNLNRTKRQLVTALSVFGSLIVSPVLAVMTVGVGVPIMLAYVYGVVPLSLCRNGACVGSNETKEADDEIAYGEEVFPIVSNKDIDSGPSRIREEEKASTSKSSFHHRRQSIASSGLVSLTDKPNTEDASIQAIAGSQYNFDSRSVHTIWSSGQYGAHATAMETTQEATSFNNEDAENASTVACCSASIAAQASEQRSITGSNSSFKTRPRSSVSNSRGNSEEPGKYPTSKIIRKISRNSAEAEKTCRILQNPNTVQKPPPSLVTPNAEVQSNENGQKRRSSRFSFRTFFRMHDGKKTRGHDQ